MSRGLIFGVWLLTIIVAAGLGWLSGVSNAAHLATTASHLTFYFVLIVMAALVGLGFYIAHRISGGHHAGALTDGPVR